MTDNLDYVTPQNDVVFKMIFADPKHDKVLLHFLNCAIESKSPITKVKILNSEITAEACFAKRFSLRYSSRN